MSDKPRVLVFIDYFLPGFRSGGPVPLLKGWLDGLGSEIQFDVITRNHDWHQDLAYPNTPEGKWLPIESIGQGNQARIQYWEPRLFSLERVQTILRENQYQSVLLNSFFSSWTRQILWWRRFQRIELGQVLLLPHGEFSPAALKIKSIKKSAYIQVGKRLKLFTGVNAIALSDAELTDLQRQSIFSQATVSAPLLADKQLKKSNHEQRTSLESLRLIFLARINPMKNLEFLLSALDGINIPVRLDVWGPADAGFPDYVNQVKREALNISHQKDISQVQIEFKGELDPSQASRVWQEQDLMVLPSRSENFGFVIWESLQNDVPCLISDRTSWVWLGSRPGLWQEPIENPSQWQKKLLEVNDLVKTKRDEIVKQVAFVREEVMKRQQTVKIQLLKLLSR